MTYIINPIWFYLMGIIDELNFVLSVITIIGVLGVGCGFLGFVTAVDDEDLIKIAKKIFITGLIISTIGILGTILIPNQKTLEKMMIASFVTEERVEEVEGKAYELVDYITEKIKEPEEEEE